MTDPKDIAVRVEIEFCDGRVVRLRGEHAAAWQRQVNGDAVMAFIHGCRAPEFPWEEDTSGCKSST